MLGVASGRTRSGGTESHTPPIRVGQNATHDQGVCSSDTCAKLTHVPTWHMCQCDACANLAHVPM